jgi:hypothetical protein
MPDLQCGNPAFCEESECAICSGGIPGLSNTPTLFASPLFPLEDLLRQRPEIPLPLTIHDESHSNP